MAQLRAQALETYPESVQALMALLRLPADVVDECAKVHRMCQVRVSSVEGVKWLVFAKLIGAG